MPMASAAMEMRPPSSTFKLSTKPSFSLPQELLRRQAAVFENHFAGGAGAHAQLVLFLSGAESRRPLLHDEGRNAVLRGGAIGHRHGDAHVGVMRVGGESLGAVRATHSPPSHHGLGARAGGVRPGFRLGQRPAAEPFARRQLRNVLPPLLVAAHLVNVVRAERSVRGHDDAHRAIHARELFNDDGVLDVAQPGAAQFLGKNGAHVAELAQFADHFERERLRLVPFHDVRQDFAFGELPNGFAKLESAPGVYSNSTDSAP